MPMLIKNVIMGSNISCIIQFQPDIIPNTSDMSHSSSEEEIKVINDQLAYLTEEIVSIDIFTKKF